MKIYLAGPCDSENRTKMVSIANRLRRTKEFEVYCPWELKIENAWDLTQEDWGAKVFWNDIQAIDACDIFLMISPGRKSTAGTNWEQGYAYAKKKKVYVIQITDKPTSLMTFCGCTHFWYCNDNDIHETLEEIIEGILDPRYLLYKHKYCETILT